jgi:hypothetical protein
MLIFDGYSSHVTQNFIEYCWKYGIRPFQLIPYSTHLTQSLDAVAFQKSKHEFKKLIREEVFYGATEISKVDFFAIFNKFSSKSFTSAICKASFKKTGLIPFNPNIVLSKMKRFGGIQNEDNDESIDDESFGFATPPRPPWTEFTTPITNTGRRRGSLYMRDRILVGNIILTAIRMIEKVEKAADCHDLVVVCVYLFNVRADHVIKSRVL